MNNKFVTGIIITVLALGSIFLAWSYFKTDQELKIVKAGRADMELNGKVIGFTSLFIRKVLQAEQEVDFETRLALENAVRDLKDEKIMAQWQNFIGSKTEAEAQDSVKTLLGTLIAKIRK